MQFRGVVCFLLIGLASLCYIAAGRAEARDRSSPADQGSADERVVYVQNESSQGPTAPATEQSGGNDKTIAEETTKLAVYTNRLFWATIAMAAIAFLQLWMFFAQWRVLRATLIGSNRPRIVLRAMQMGTGDHSELGPGHAITSITFMIANVGSSGAELKSSSISAGLRKVGAQEIPTYNGDRIECKTRWFRPGDTEQVHSNLEVPAALPAILSPIYGEQFVVSGYLVYFDEVGVRRQSYFYRIWDEKSKRFFKSEDPDLEFEY